MDGASTIPSDDPMAGGDPMAGEQPPMDGQDPAMGGDPMMDDPAMGGEQQPMMESFIFTKKQLNTLMENFGPTEDELQKQDERKPLPKKKEKTVSNKSPFNSPRFK